MRSSIPGYRVLLSLHTQQQRWEAEGFPPRHPARFLCVTQAADSSVGFFLLLFTV